MLALPLLGSACFLGMSLLVGCLVVRSPVSSAASTGWEFRVWFQTLLMLACLARGGMLLISIFFIQDAPNLSEASFFNDVLHVIPSLLFFSGYSLLMLFWAHLVFAHRPRVDAYLWPGFVFLNVAVYAVFGTLAGVTAGLRAYANLLRPSLCFLSVLHLGLALGFLYFGVQLTKDLRERSAMDGQIGALMRRVTIICGVCTTVFLAQGIFNLLVGAGVLEDFHPSGSLPNETWDTCFYVLFEFVPSAVVLYILLPSSSPSASTQEQFDRTSLNIGAHDAVYSQVPDWQQTSTPLL